MWNFDLYQYEFSGNRIAGQNMKGRYLIKGICEILTGESIENKDLRRAGGRTRIELLHALSRVGDSYGIEGSWNVVTEWLPINENGLFTVCLKVINVVSDVTEAEAEEVAGEVEAMFLKTVIHSDNLSGSWGVGGGFLVEISPDISAREVEEKIRGIFPEDEVPN